MSTIEILFWRSRALQRGHIRPSTADVIEWLMFVAIPLAVFVENGNWWIAVLGFAFARLLIPQWGMPPFLRWEI